MMKSMVYKWNAAISILLPTSALFSAANVSYTCTAVKTFLQFERR